MGMRIGLGMAMRMRMRQGLILVAILAGCATVEDRGFTTGEASAKVRQQYQACLFAASDKMSKAPASADEITAYAEGECRSRYLSYADAVRAEFAAGADSSAQKQYAYDKADAHLRQMLVETRRILSDRISLQSLTGQAPEPVSR